MAESEEAPRPAEQWSLFVLKALLLFAVLVPRWLSYSSAGGLWRDEVHSVNMATAPTDDLFFALTNDSFPALWAVVLRGWIASFGSSDQSVRILGFLIGLAIIPAMIWMARQFGVVFPWWLILLLGLDPSLIVYGGEVRGYGLGILTLLLLIGASWRTLKNPTSWSWTVLLLLSLLAVQSSYTNCFLLMATFIACGIVSLRRRKVVVCAGFGTVGILAATSMLPYVLFVFPRLSGLIKPFVEPVPWWTPASVFLDAYKWGGGPRSLIWLVVGLVGVIHVLRQLNPRSSEAMEQSDEEQNLALFLPPFFWIGTAGFWCYMGMLRVHTAYWYHLPFLALLAVTTDIQMDLWTRHNRRRQILSISLSIITCVAAISQVTDRVSLRMTTLDLIASSLEESVQEGDLVVVAPWYLGVPFHRYYRGQVEWTKVPDIDGRFRPFEELTELHKVRPAARAIDPGLERITATLQNGKRVWWVGPLTLMTPETSAALVAGQCDPKPDANGREYVAFWEKLAIARMQTQGIAIHERKFARRESFNQHEIPSIFLIESTQMITSNPQATRMQ